MRYMLLITQGEWMVNGSEAERAASLEKVALWWGEQFASGKMVGGEQLQSHDTATTVVLERGKHVVLDRPLMEAKEAIGGYGILQVADIDEALAIVQTMPLPDGKIELRPLLERAG